MARSHTKYQKKKIKSVGDRYRLNIFRSNANIYCQIIDDTKGVTLASASTFKLKNGGNVLAAKEAGKLIAQAAKAKKIAKVVFDRNGYPYRGRVKALAEAAREHGLVF